MALTRRKFIARSSLLAASSTLVPGSALSALAQSASPSDDIGAGGNSMDFDMAPETTLEVVNAALKQVTVPMAPGPFKPDWESLRQN